jgi:hypothetical protein
MACASAVPDERSIMAHGQPGGPVRYSVSEVVAGPPRANVRQAGRQNSIDTLMRPKMGGIEPLDRVQDEGAVAVSSEMSGEPQF